MRFDRITMPIFSCHVTRVTQLFSRNVVAIRNAAAGAAAGGGEILFLVEDSGAHTSGDGAMMEEEAKAEEGESQGDADVSSSRLCHVTALRCVCLMCC
jgi:hypothetical protein